MVYKHYNSWEWETFINLISSIKWIQTQYRLYGIDMRNYSRFCDYKAVRLNFKKYNILAQLKGNNIENPSTISFPIFLQFKYAWRITNYRNKQKIIELIITFQGYF